MIFIPSYKRAENCKTAQWLSQAVICCHKFEAKQYRKHNRNRMVAIPDGLQGKGMAGIRNWVLEQSSTDEVLMMDDDLSSVGYWDDQQKIRMNEFEVYRFVDQGFRMCRELGTVLWGINLIFDKKAYREYSPFSFSSVILGPFMGIVRTDIRFDESLGLKEDFDYSIQVLNRYRGILRFNKYHYTADHLVGRGGCTSYRTRAKERQQRERFVAKWGSKIVQFKEGDMNPIVKVPIAGI